MSMNVSKRKISIVLKTPFFYFCVCFVVVNLLFTRQILNNNGLGVKVFLLVAFVELAVELAVFFVVTRMRAKNVPLERQFLFVALVIGSLFIVFLPPGQSPDEITHFRRIYGISEGVLIPGELSDGNGAVGSDVPVNAEFLAEQSRPGMYNEIIDQLGLSAKEKSEQPYTTAALYSFVCYIPQVTAALIGKMLNFSVMGMAYLMEIFNFAVFVILIYYAIKFIPKHKIVVMFISLLPITIQEATSLAPDAITIGLSVFIVSFILYLAYGIKKEMKRMDYIVLSAAMLVIGFCKIVYLPLVTLVMLIPRNKYGSKKKKWIFISFMFVAVAVVNLAWLGISSQYLVASKAGVDPKAQMLGVIANPFKYSVVVIRSINVYGIDWIKNLLGISLGSFKFDLQSLMFVVSFVLMTILFAQREETLKLKKWSRLLIIWVFFVIAILIFTSLYIQWTVYGADTIDGVQGRYFLPILLLVPLIISRLDNKSPHMNLITPKMILCYSLFINVAALVTFFAQNV